MYTQYEHLHTYVHTTHTHLLGTHAKIWNVFAIRIGSALMDMGVPGSAVCRLEHRRAYTVISV